MKLLRLRFLALVIILLSVIQPALVFAQTPPYFQVNGHIYGPAFIIDTTGNTVLNDSADYYFLCDSVIVCKKGDYYSFRNLTTLKKTADSIEELGCDMFTDMIYAKKRGKWGYYNEKGNLKIKHKYDEASGFYEGIALVKISEKYYYIDQNGTITKNISSEVREHFNTFGTGSLDAVSAMPRFRMEGYKTFKENELWGIVNTSTGEIILKAQFNEIVNNANDLVIVIKDKKYGIINFKTGKYITDCKHYHINILTK